MPNYEPSNANAAFGWNDYTRNLNESTAKTLFYKRQKFPGDYITSSKKYCEESGGEIWTAFK